MPWYRFEARHGPDHQSISVEYEWYEETLDEALLSHEWRHWVEREDMDYPIGRATLDTDLPKQIVEEKIAYYEVVIKEAQTILQELKAEKREKME